MTRRKWVSRKVREMAATETMLERVARRLVMFSETWHSLSEKYHSKTETRIAVSKPLIRGRNGSRHQTGS